MLSIKNREDIFPIMVVVAFVPFIVSAVSLIINLALLLPLLILGFFSWKIRRPYKAAKMYARSVIPSLRTEELNVVCPQRNIMDTANDSSTLRLESTKALAKMAETASHIALMELRHPYLPEPDKLKHLSINSPRLHEDFVPLEFYSRPPKEINDDGLQMLAKQIHHVDNFIQRTKSVAQLAMCTSPNTPPGVFPLTVRRECKKLERNNQ